MRRCPTCGAVFPESFRFCGADGTPLEDHEPLDPLLGHVVGGAYRLREKLGAGGFGVVYRARHERMPLDVAVKLLSEVRATDPSMVARFRQEVQAEALIGHPNIVRVLDTGLDARAGHFIAMELLQGQDLARRLDTMGRLPVLDVFAILDQTLAGLDAAHRLGIVHRDVKAENIFLQTDATEPQGYLIKLLDFGLARLTRTAVTADGRALRRAPAGSRPSRALGSPATIAPEVVAGQAAEPHSDLYSVACVAFELWTGTILFDSANLDEMLRNIMHKPPVAPSTVVGAQWIPPELDALMLGALAKDPAQRPPSAARFRAALERVRPATEAAWAGHFLTHGAGRGTALPPLQRPLPDLSHRRIPADRPRPLVLAVDDDRVIRMLVSKLVEAAGCDCTALDSADAAMAWLADNPPPDAVVSDLLMPGLDGLGFLAELRRHGFAGPAVLCTSAASAPVRAEAAGRLRAAVLDKAGELHQVVAALEAAGLRTGRGAP